MEQTNEKMTFKNGYYYHFEYYSNNNFYGVVTSHNNKNVTIKKTLQLNETNNKVTLYENSVLDIQFIKSYKILSEIEYLEIEKKLLVQYYLNSPMLKYVRV